MTRIAVISTSTRPTRRGDDVAVALAAALQQQVGDDTLVEVIDLATLDLPLLSDIHEPAKNNYTEDHTRAWSETVRQLDGIVWLTPEYNGMFTAAAKNAIDTLFVEWKGKPTAIVGYGHGGARRAIDVLSTLCRNLRMQLTDTPAALTFGDHLSEQSFAASDMVQAHDEQVAVVAKELLALIETKPGR